MPARICGSTGPLPTPRVRASHMRSPTGRRSTLGLPRHNDFRETLTPRRHKYALRRLAQTNPQVASRVFKLLQIVFGHEMQELFNLF